MSTFVLDTDAARAAEWRRVFAEKMPDLGFRLWDHQATGNDVRYLATWTPPANLEQRFPNLEILFSTGAGVDQFDLCALPDGVRLVRLVEPGIINGMVEYVSMMALALHRDLFTYLDQQRNAEWKPVRVYPCSTRRIGIMGMGRLGEAVAARLVQFGFRVSGWSRSRRVVPDVTCYAGQEEFRTFLASTDILICLVPLTDETRGILDADLFAGLPRGAMLLNAGRGGHLNEHDFKAALDSGQLSRAVFDVVDPEPLPEDHWFWRDPRIVVTPHIASMTQPETAAEAVIANICRHQAGQPLVGLVDPAGGY